MRMLMRWHSLNDRPLDTALPLVVPGVFFPLDATTFEMSVRHLWNNATLATMLETFCKN